MKPLPVIFFVTLFGCTGSTDAPSDPPADPSTGAATEDPSLVLEAEADAHEPLSWEFRLELEQGAPIHLACEDVSPPYERHEVQLASSVDHQVTLRGLKPETVYRCTAMLADGTGRTSSPSTVSTQPLPSDLKALLPQVTVVPEEPIEVGYTLLNLGWMNRDLTYSTNYLVILDPWGNVRWYYEGIGGGDIDATYLPGGRILFGGFGGGTTSHPPTIVDLDRNVLFTANSLPTYSTEIPGTYHHDAGLAHDGLSIFTFVREFSSDGWEGFVIKQIDLSTNQIIWSWDSILDGVGSGAFPPGSSENPDPYHVNTIWDRIEGGRLSLYVSLRNFDQVIKIDHETKAVVAKIGVNGDYTLLESDGSPASNTRWFFAQHDVKRYDDLLVVHDNGTGRSRYGGTDYSRALILKLNDTSRTAQIVSEYSEPGWVEAVWGGYDLLPDGGSLLAMGHCWLCGPAIEHTSSLLELNERQEVVWRVDFSEPRAMLYRAEHIDSCDIFQNVTLCPAR